MPLQNLWVGEFEKRSMIRLRAFLTFIAAKHAMKALAGIMIPKQLLEGESLALAWKHKKKAIEASDTSIAAIESHD